MGYSKNAKLERVVSSEGLLKIFPDISMEQFQKNIGFNISTIYNWFINSFQMVWGKENGTKIFRKGEG